MTNKQMKLPGPDHPISIEKSRFRVVVTVGGKVIADTDDASGGLLSGRSVCPSSGCRHGRAVA